MKTKILLSLLFASTANAGIVFSDYEADHSNGLKDIVSAESLSHQLPAKDFLEKLAPTGWKVNLGPGIANYLLAWQPASSWRGTIQQIQSLNTGIYIRLNEAQKVIAVSKNQEELTYLSSRNASIWSLDPKLSLRENFEVWNSQSNLDIIWDSKFDFPVRSHSVLVGDLTGKNGVIDRILKETLKTKEPLWATYLPHIGAIHIVPGGSTEKGKGQ